ncbi:MAG TPA: hypothetical protein VGS96_19375 [Thermoanaerobaculia bacterium]|nr:hypothetical protein [Thermoanaerobaculia bacterium]
MRVRTGVVAAAVVAALLAAGCTGGKESTAAEEQLPQKNGIAPSQQAAAAPDPRKELRAIGPAIPFYAGARYRDDLTRRDEVMVRNQYGPQAKVYTLATDDSFPQVYHYYTTYLAQFRAFPPQSPYPPEQQNWRTLEVQLNQAMQDPFIPGESLRPDGSQIVLQVAETEAEPKTVIRYIVTPPAGEAVATSALGAPAAPAAR